MSKRRRGGRSKPAGAASAGSGPSQRQLRVGESVRQALAGMIQRGRLRDDAGAELRVTVTEVRLTPDLRNATCFVVPLGTAADVVGPLNRLAPLLGGEIGRALRLRYAPRLSFVYDRSFETASSIEALLRRPEVARDLVGDDRDRKDED